MAARPKSWLDALLSFFYPEYCRYCEQARAMADEGYICDACTKHARFVVPPFCERCGLPFPTEVAGPFQCHNCHNLELFFTTARSAVAASGMVLELIHRYKYHRALWLEPFLARLLVQAAAPELSQEAWDMIVPVPLHSLKLREREFNQAERLARHLSRATRIPLQARLLRRVKPTSSQTRLSKAERAANVRAAFAVASHSTLRNQRVVLVDDVFTTGATSSACARALRQAGARSVCVWTFARGLFK